MGNTEKTLIKLFEAYSKNLEAFFPDLAGKFLCPLCKRLLSIEDLEKKKITIEHIIPSAIGGKLITLTCAACNHGAGAKLDAELLKRLQVEDVFSGKGSKPLRGKIKVGEGEQTVDLNIEFEDRPIVDLVGLPKYSNPSLQEAAIEEFEKGKGIEIRVEFEGYRVIPSYVAIIRSAYLMMFSFFGYGYILNPNLKIVLEQIQNFTAQSNVLYGIVEIQEAKFNANQINICQLSPSLFCFLPTLNFSTNKERYYSIVMPGLEHSGKRLYDNWKMSLESATFEVKIWKTILFDPSSISSPWLPHQIWREVESIGK